MGLEVDIEVEMEDVDERQINTKVRLQRLFTSIHSSEETRTTIDQQLTARPPFICILFLLFFFLNEVPSHRNAAQVVKNEKLNENSLIFSQQQVIAPFLSPILTFFPSTQHIRRQRFQVDQSST